ncbi:MAG: aminotransferase class I/II-fold pyridoxal phosphate-dependent enzyme [Candidatus Sulfotelmatobacter sp.]
MRLKPFLLDAWLDTYEHGIEFNLASSAGPAWTANELLDLGGEESRQRYLNHKVGFGPTAGADSLREAIAEMQGVSVDHVQVVTGASEALVVLMWLAAGPGANVILPLPGLATFSALPESLGLELRYYRMLRENSFRIDVDEIKRLADLKTKLILVNSPHNPTGATISDSEMEALHEFTSLHDMQLISDEVFHPIYHGRGTKSAARLPHATVINNLSKAFPLAGTRVGWIIERDAERRQQYLNARSYFSGWNSTPGEILAEIAVRHRSTVLGKTQETASRNLRQLDRFMASQRDVLGWIRPQGGMTAFPWFLNGEDTRPFCQAAAERGILLVPGDCFDVPSHFRLGFAASADNFDRGLGRLEEFVKSWSAKMVTSV